MKFSLARIVFCFTVCTACASQIPVQAAASNEHALMPVECKVALHLVTSKDYVNDHQGEIPDVDKMDDNARIAFVTKLFNDTINKSDDQINYCTNTIRDNLRYTNAYHFPKQCVEFMPLLKQSFEEKNPYAKDGAKFVQQHMDDSVIDMLIMDETAPNDLIARCETGIAVMHVDLNDRHLKEKYPLPPTCEAFFDAMEKTLVLPTQLITMKRQRVIFAIENKDTPKRLDEICEEISH